MLVELSNGCISAHRRGSGRPILVLHGGGLDHRHMVDAIELVFEENSDWERFYIDLPGHGASKVDASVQSQDDVLDMIIRFADLSFNGDRFAVIGESRGSYHAMGLAHTRPDFLLGMMLIVADAMPGSTANWRPKHQILMPAPDEILNSLPPNTAERFARLVVQNADILEKILKTKIPPAERVDEYFAARLRKNFDFSFDLSKPTTAFDKPALVVNGRQDAMAGYYDMIEGFQRYPRATFAVLDCAGHSLAWERPELFQALAQDWLQRMHESLSSE